jgi:hypothetical protein
VLAAPDESFALEMVNLADAKGGGYERLPGRCLCLLFFRAGELQVE